MVGASCLIHRPQLCYDPGVFYRSLLILKKNIMLNAIRSAGTIKILIVLFWIALLFMLVRRVHLVPEINIDTSENLAESESYMSIFFKGKKIGFSEQSLTRTDTGYIMDQNTFMRLNLMGSVQELRTYTSARMGLDQSIKTFDFFMSAGPVKFQAAGKLDGRFLTVVSSTGGHTSRQKLELEETPRLASGIMPYLASAGLEKGKRYKVPIFDPSTLSTRPVLAVVEDFEKVIVDGNPVDTYRVRMDYHDTQSYTWVDSEGRTIKEEGLLGLSMVRTTEEKAKEGISGNADLADVLAATSAPSSKPISKPRQVKYLKVRLKGLDLKGLELDGGRQKLTGDVVEIVREKIDVRLERKVPAKSFEFKKYLEPEPYIQSNHINIRTKARSIVGQSNPVQAIDKITAWVFDNLEKRPTMSVPSALAVLDAQAGDCNEHAVLTAALLRSMNIPAKVCVGVLYYQGRFYYHAWLEVYWGQWTAIDPLLGQVPADATHIRFITGGLSRQVDLVRVIGRLEVEILDIK